MKRREFLLCGLKGLAAGGLAASVGGAPGIAFAQRANGIVDPRGGSSGRDLDSTRGPRRQAEESAPNLFVFARLKYTTLSDVPAHWDAHPFCDDMLLEHLRKTTRLKLSALPFAGRTVDIDKPATFFSLPFIFMTGEGDFHLDRFHADAFAEYFRRGGFLYADDCVYDFFKVPGDFLYKAFVREFANVLPQGKLAPVPGDHPIYHCLYEFPDHAPKPKGIPNPDMGLFLKDRLVAFATSTDIHCGWGVERFRQLGLQEPCLKMGANIVIYALTH